jgi:hypothetical protein
MVQRCFSRRLGQPDTRMFAHDTDPLTLSQYAVTEKIRDAAALFARLGAEPLRGSRWIFRGQAHADWGLEPTLERFARSLNELPSAIETYAVREFKRQAHHYANDLPGHDDDLEWLALMRHHGAPTRLVDFSKSPYIATFFATAEAESTNPAAVWALDVVALREYAAVILTEEKLSVRFAQIGERCLRTPGLSFGNPEVFSALTSGSGPFPTTAIPVEPFRTSERMMLQQGVFLCSVSPYDTFTSSLKAVLRKGTTDPCGKKDLLHKLVIEPAAHPHILRELYRMNLNHASLIPGLDGLAQSLSTVCKIRASTVPPHHRPDYAFGAAL